MLAGVEYDRFFWAGCRVGLRRNTCADRLKSTYYFFCGPPKQRPFFFLGMLKPILKLLPVWISPVAQARFQQLIFYGLPDRIVMFPSHFSLLCTRSRRGGGCGCFSDWLSRNFARVYKLSQPVEKTPLEFATEKV